MLGVLLTLVVLVPAGLAAASVVGDDSRRYSSLDSNPGYQVGAWLDSRFPTDTSIMQNAGAYIPPRYDHMLTLPYGDPFASLATAKPEVMVVNLQFMDDVGTLPRTATDPVLMTNAGVVQDFYAELLSGKLGYRVVKRLPSTATRPGFVVLQRSDGT